MTEEELTQKFTAIIKQQDWLAQLANEAAEEDSGEIAVAAVTALLGLVVAAKAMQRLALLRRFDIDKSLADSSAVALFARTSTLVKAQIIATLIVRAGPDAIFDIEQSATVQ